MTAPGTLREIEDVRAFVQSAPLVEIVGRGTKWPWRTRAVVPKHEDGFGQALHTRHLRGVIDYSPKDQVLSVKAGSRVFEVQRLLAGHGQCLPLGSCGLFRLDRGSIGGAIAMNLPHLLEGRNGSWRDWVLGLRVVLADGTVARSGSHAVKNVAGYDAHKLFIGSRGTLGVIVEATIRTYPLAALEGHSSKGILLCPSAAQRVQRSDFDAACKCMKTAYLSDPSSSTLWFACDRDEAPARYPGDWLLRTMCGEKNLQITDPTQIRLMKRAKEIFDPTSKLNPGEMGIF